jgi:hypothetical protein
MMLNKRNLVAIMTRTMPEAHHHSHCPDGPPANYRVDTLLGSVQSRLLAVGLVCVFMWAVLWLAVRGA